MDGHEPYPDRLEDTRTREKTDGLGGVRKVHGRSRGDEPRPRRGCPVQRSHRGAQGRGRVARGRQRRGAQRRDRRRHRGGHHPLSQPRRQAQRRDRGQPGQPVWLRPRPPDADQPL